MKSRRLIQCINIFFFCFFSVCLFAQKHVRLDSSFVAKRFFSDSSINAFKNNKDFQYDKWQEPPESVWDRFWDWIWQKWDELLSTASGRGIVWTVLIAFGVAMIAFFVWKVTGMNKMGLFAKDDKGNLNYEIGEEDIHSISFDDAINKAISNKNYRLAVRLFYLQTLKLLSDKELINWQLNKTNFSYVKELQNHSLQLPFAKLTNIFEYAWYGNKDVAADRFENIKEEFHQFQHQL